jgi:hypothetical protein
MVGGRTMPPTVLPDDAFFRDGVNSRLEVHQRFAAKLHRAVAAGLHHPPWYGASATND